MHPKELWDFGDPAASEARFRQQAATTSGPERAVWLTQVARALGLQGRYVEGHAVLDAIPGEATESAEVGVRLLLERGRLHRSAGDPATARSLFAKAVVRAAGAILDELHVDALHMVALVSEPADQVAIIERALAVARAATDPHARDWDASLLNNLGMAYADLGDHEAALAMFEHALAACERIGERDRIRVARWMVGWSLRHLGRREEAIALQRALKAELEAAGEEDPYVDEELSELLRSEERGADDRRGG